MLNLAFPGTEGKFAAYNWEIPHRLLDWCLFLLSRTSFTSATKQVVLMAQVTCLTVLKCRCKLTHNPSDPCRGGILTAFSQILGWRPALLGGPWLAPMSFLVFDPCLSSHFVLCLFLAQAAVLRHTRRGQLSDHCIKMIQNLWYWCLD